MKASLILSFAALFLGIASIGCVSDDDENVCLDAASICGESQHIDSDQCVGVQAEFARCIVEHGTCDAQTVIECAAGTTDGGVPDGAFADAFTPDASTELAATLEIESSHFSTEGYDPIPVSLDLTVKITNSGESTPIPVSGGYYYVESTTHEVYDISNYSCGGASALAVGGSETCILSSHFSAGTTPARLIYRVPSLGKETSISLDSILDGYENTVETCTDGISNDGDKYIDCDDYDCCNVVSCPADSSCGSR